jgi:hypothetical protein
MNFFSISQWHQWQIAAGATVCLVACILVLWLIFRHRPTPAEIERARRTFLVQSGRLLDGMLLDTYELEGEDGRTLTLLLFNYRIGGVDYECSQDITDMQDVVKPESVRIGFPCSVRYQPGNPQNSIVVAETWTGLRIGLPHLPVYEDPEPLDVSHIRRK